VFLFLQMITDETFYFLCYIVEYKKNQDPYLLQTWKYASSSSSIIALSPDARTVALATGANISFFSVASDECDQLIEDAFSGEFFVCVRGYFWHSTRDVSN
jgi:hypothetical protein